MQQKTGIGIVLIGVALLLAFALWYANTMHITKDAEMSEDTMCAQVITDARDPETGEVREFPTPCDVPEGWDTLETDREFFSRNGEEWQRYRNDDLGVRFEYRIAPDGYLLIEQDESAVPSDALVEYVLLYDRKEYAALLESTEPREGPPAIAVLIFDNPDQRTPREWVEAEAMLSNVNLLQGAIETTTLGGAPAVRYTVDGLYTSDVIVAKNNGRMYMFSGAYAARDAAIRNDFLSILASVSLY